MNKQSLFTNSFLLIGIWFVSLVHANAQNINIPNKTGPLGLQVNTLTGNLYFSRNDLYIPARGFSMNISFHYNSFNFDKNDGYGNGWSFDYNIRYKNDTAGGKIIIWGDGREDSYRAAGAGTFLSPRGFFTNLTEYQPGKYRILETDGVAYFFDNNSHKRITRMEEPNGNFISFLYTDTLLTSLTNGAGQSISLAYTNGKLTTVTDAMTSPTRTFTYLYDGAGNLKEAKDPLNNSTKYAYLVNGPMKEVTDKNNNKVDIVYFSNFTTSELVGCNKRISFSYDTSTLITMVTDYLETGSNQVTKYEFKNQGDKKWLSSMSGNCCGFNMKFEFDDNGNKVKETDAKGNVTTFTYDNRGNMLTMTDAMSNTVAYTYTEDYNRVASFTDEKGFTTSMSYDSKGNLIQLTEPGNLIYTATYAANGDITGSTDPEGNTFTYNYDPYGHPVNVTGPGGYTAQLAFDARGNLLSFSDARGNTSNLEFDILGRLKKITDPINNTIQLNYDAEGNPVLLNNQNSETSNLAFDASNRLVQITNPEGGKTKVTYDAMNNIKSITNAIGNKANFEYDNRNRLKKLTDPEGNILSVGYDANGNPTSLNMPNGQLLNYSYDGLNRVTSVTDLTGMVLSLTYDKNSNITGFTNSSGAAYAVEYDNLNRIRKITDPLNNSYTLGYDNNGNVTTVTDRNGFTSVYTYDSLDRIKTMTDNNGNTVTPFYDAEGNLTALKDQNNNTSSYIYDNLNRLKRVTYPDGRYIENTYDNKSNIIARRVANGTTINYIYDTLNRVISKTLPDGQVYTYTYDALGRVLTAANNTGTVALTYDALNRITSETFGGRTVNYNYNVAGRIQTITYPDNTIVAKTYDTRNHITSITKNNAVLVSYQYNNAGQLVSKTMANGVTTSYRYDFANRLSNISTGGGLIQNSNFFYNNERHKTSVDHLNDPGRSEQFTYDNGRRLTNYKRGIIGETPVVENSYTYDALGNRIAANLNGISTTYTSNNLNQLVNSNNGTQNINFMYDNNGNLTYDGQFYKNYDAEGRLVKDSSSPGNVLSYQYDALHRRVRKNQNGAVLDYTFSGLSPIEERDNASGTVLNKTIFSGFLTPVVNEKNSTQFFYHQNELNSVEAISNQQGRLLEKYVYDVYGKMNIYDSLNNLLPGSLAGNRFGFTGQVYDSATGRYKFFFREYNPETGLFNQRDLLGYADGMGMYQYVHNNPANGIDILGLEDGILSTIMDLIGNTVGNANSISPLLSEVSPGVQQYIATSQKGGQLLRVAEMPLELGLGGQMYNGTLKFLNSTGLGFVLTPINIIGTIKSYNKMNDPCSTDGQKVDASISTLSGGLNSGMGLYVIGVFSYNSVGSYALLNMANAKLLGNAMPKGDMLRIASKFGLEKAGGAFGSFSGGTLVAEAGLGGLLSALAGGLAIEGAVNFGWQMGTGQSLSESAEQDWFDVPGFTKGVEWYTGEHAADWETKAIQRNQMFSGNLESYLKAKAKVDAKGSHGGGGHWKAPKPGRPNDPCDQSGGTQNPIRIIGNLITSIIEAITSMDPNEIIGPDGMPDKNWVSINDRLPYTVTFENDKSAGAPAKYVKVIAPAHEKMDAATFQLGSFGFNSLTFSVPPSTSSYYQRLDCRDSLGLYVDITAGYDVQNNQAFWEFQSIDPVTLLPPADPLKGFLLRQDSLNNTSGHGFVNFSIKPVTTAQTLDSILARADIMFDSNDTIPTNIERNTIDAFPPVSSISNLPDSTINTEITISYTGIDDLGGSGVKWFSIYVSDNGGAPELYAANFRGTDTTFTGVADHLYRFYITAADSTGNIEVLKLADSIFVKNGEYIICPDGNITFDSGLPGTSYQWQVDTGSGFTNITDGGVYNGTGTSLLSISNAPSSMYGYQYRCIVNSNNYSTIFLLKFGMTWEGTVSTAWEDPANWSCNSLPDENTDVIVDGGKPNYPQVNSNVSIRTLRFRPGASGTVNSGFTLTILK